MGELGYNIKQIVEEIGCSRQLVTERLSGYKNYNAITARLRYINKSTIVYCYTLTGEYLTSFPNATLAAKTLGHNINDTILNCLNGKINSAYGYQWRRYKTKKIDIVAVTHGKLV